MSLLNLRCVKPRCFNFRENFFTGCCIPKRVDSVRVILFYRLIRHQIILLSLCQELLTCFDLTSHIKKERSKNGRIQTPRFRSVKLGIESQRKYNKFCDVVFICHASVALRPSIADENYHSSVNSYCMMQIPFDLGLYNKKIFFDQAPFNS